MRSFFVRRRGCLLWVSGGALGWLVTSACSSPEERAPALATEGTSPPPPGGEVTRTTEATAPSDAMSEETPDASVIMDAEVEAAAPKTVTLYDTYAVALYFDGTLGPKTGIIEVADVALGKALTLDFWHGHGGILHRFTLVPDDFEKLKAKQKVTTKTTIVEGHQHELFVDPVDPKWRVPGAQPQTIPV